LTIAVSTPAMASRSSAWSISGLPATATNGFGMRSVNGRILVPNPAAKTMALGGKKEDIGVPVAELSYD
jgi:hypothetical protein